MESTIGYEQECRLICERLSQIEGRSIRIERQLGGNIELTGVYRRFYGWDDALEYLIEMLEAAQYNQSLGLRMPYVWGEKNEERTQKPPKIDVG